MKTLIEYIKESFITEGGNAVEAQPIPAYITPIIYGEIANKVMAWKKDVEIAPLGSMGLKKDDDFNGDIDIAINIEKDELIEMCEELFPDCEINKFTTPTVVSIGYKYDIKGVSGIAQVDFMFTENVKWKQWRNRGTDMKNCKSKYKAVPMVYMERYIFQSIPVKDAKDEFFDDGEIKLHWRYCFNDKGVYKQLENWCGKSGKKLTNPKKMKEFEEFITNNPEEVMAFAFGDNYDPKDFESAESLWAAIHSKKWPWGEDAVKYIEQQWQDDYINGKGMKEYPVDPSDFPCEYI